MARTIQVIESVTCDRCGKSTTEAAQVILGWGRDKWELDVCPADMQKLEAQFGKWVEKGRKPTKARSGHPKRRPRAESLDEWAYLESLGFRRHRGRRSAAEIEALQRRGSARPAKA